MNMFDLDLTLFAMLFGVAACIGLVVLQRRLAEQTARAAQLQQQMTLLSQSISGLTAGAVGMDRRMRRLQMRERLLTERQETYDIQQADDQPYSHAIRLVQQGAATSRLVEELGLSESEAELILRLHGRRETA
jgi:nitrate reductase gamma subunit